MNWERVLFEQAPFEIIDGDRGKNYPKKGDLFHDGFCLFLNTGNVTKNGFVFSDCKFVSEDRDLLLRKGKLQRDDVVLTTRGTIGNIGHYSENIPFENVRINSGMVILRCDTLKILPEYLYAFLQSEDFSDQVERLRSGAAQPQLPIRDLNKADMPLPPIHEQRVLVSAYLPYTDLIATNQRRIQLLEEASRRLYREWFVRLRFPEYEEVSVVDGIPEGWQSGFAHEFLDVMSGGTPKTSIENYWNGDIPFFTPKDAPDGIYVTKTEKNITEDGLSKCNSKLYPKETVFITARGTVGKLALAQCPMAMNQSCYAIKTKENLGVNNLWMFLAVQSAVEHFKQAASEGVFRSIVVNTFKTIPLICPSPAITHQFGDLLRPLFDQVEILMLQNSRLKLARDQLLPKLMSGQLDISRIKIESPVVEAG